jgi:hypothetical protein
VIYFVMAIIIGTKATGGCMQFFDFSFSQMCKKAWEAAATQRRAGTQGADVQTEHIESTQNNADQQ